MTNFLSLSSKALTALLFALPVVSPTVAQEVDVYFITGQSNSGNMGEMNSYDVQGYNGYNGAMFNAQTPFNFEFTFARIRDRTGTFGDGTPRVGGPVTDVVEAVSGVNLLDPVNYAVDNIAVQMNAESGNDIGIFCYGRNGRALANITDESWFPGTVDAPFNDELYGYFQTWSQDRLDEIEAGADGVAGTADDQVATVRGIFWFQGENDSDDAGARAAYQTNFENLIARFRADFNDPELPIVASEIREINANDSSINQSLNAVAASDDFVSVIDISNASIYTPVSANDVHLNALGLLPLSDDFAEQMIALQGGALAPPVEPAVGIVYQDTFDNDGLAVNAGVGGGGVATQFNGAGGVNWGFNDVDETGTDGATADESGLFAGTAASGNRIATFVSSNGFDLSPGFTLTVVFDQLTNDGTGPAFPSDHFSFGLLSTMDTSGNFFEGLDGGSTVAGVDAIGVSLGIRAGNAEIGVVQWDEDVQTTLNALTNADVIGDDLTFVLTVDAAGNYTYTLGAASGSGTTSVDLSTAFFKARTQGSNGNSIESVTIDVVSDFLIGDVNLDGDVNFLDISPFIGLLSSDSFQLEADINEDGEVNFLDISPFIGLLSS